MLSQFSSTMDREALLRTVLKRVKTTVVLGTANKIDEAHEKQFIGNYLAFRNRSNGYFMRYSQLDSRYQEFLNRSPWKNQGSVWKFYAGKSRRLSALDIYLRQEKVDPLKDSQFNLSEGIKQLLVDALIAEETRIGNCGARVALAAKYLWEEEVKNPRGLVKKLEVLSFNTFDHAVLVINRKGKLTDPSTWGEAMIMDPWYQDGIIFSATEFLERVQEIARYAKRHVDGFIAAGVPVALYKENEPITWARWVKIKIGFHHYPSYAKPTAANPAATFLPLDYYCRIFNYAEPGYPSKLQGSIFQKERENHKEKFAPCLAAIRTMSNR